MPLARGRARSFAPAVARPGGRLAGAPLAPFLCGLLAAGCSVDATGVLVTVRTGSCQPDALHVSVLRRGSSLAEHDYPGPIADGATFGVQLADSLDGASVTIALSARLGGAQCDDRGEVVVARHAARPLELSVGACCPGGGDAGVGDLPRGDLGDGGPDQSVPGHDLDLMPGPDLQCTPGCSQGIQTVCENGKARSIACSFGACNGADCPGPASCMAAGDISAPATYGASTAGAKSTGRGSCLQEDGPDNTLKFASNSWGTWSFEVAATFRAELYARQSCADPASELVMDGLCSGALVSSACVAGAASASQTLCGLPPGQPYYAFVKDPLGQGGAYQITSRFTAVDLSDCKNAGMLPGSSFSLSGDTSLGKNQFAAPLNQNTMNCSDRGAAAPELVYWIPVTRQQAASVKMLKVTVTGKNGYLPLVYGEQYCLDMSATCGTFSGNVATFAINKPVPEGGWYIFVDGQNGSKGQFDLTMTLQ